MEKIVVVEIWDREVVSTTECDTMEEAVEAANELLENHVKTIHHLEEFKDGEGKGSEWELATGSNQNAWCNWRGNWDAHIIEY